MCICIDLDRSNLRAEVRVAEKRSHEGTEVTMTYVIMGFSATPGLHLYLHINDELVKEEPTGRLECIPEDSVTLTYTKVIQQGELCPSANQNTKYYMFYLSTLTPCAVLNVDDI